MENFDFVKGFAGVDLLATEAVARVVGRTLGALMKGMCEAGLEDHEAHAVVAMAWREFLIALPTLMASGVGDKKKGESDGV